MKWKGRRQSTNAVTRHPSTTLRQAIEMRKVGVSPDLFNAMLGSIAESRDSALSEMKFEREGFGGLEAITTSMQDFLDFARTPEGEKVAAKMQSIEDRKRYHDSSKLIQGLMFVLGFDSEEDAAIRRERADRPFQEFKAERKTKRANDHR